MPRKAKIIPFPGAPAPPSTDAQTVAVHRCDPPEALVVRSLLESEGIPTLLRSRMALSVHPFTVGSQGEVAVLVPRDHERRSRLILSRVLARLRVVPRPTAAD